MLKWCTLLVFSFLLASWQSVLPAADQDEIQKAQQLLAEKGFEPGAVDGVMGRQTRTAIRRFQQENSLEPTGMLDHSTKSALGIANTEDNIPPGVLEHEAKIHREQADSIFTAIAEIKRQWQEVPGTGLKFNVTMKRSLMMPEARWHFSKNGWHYIETSTDSGEFIPFAKTESIPVKRLNVVLSRTTSLIDNPDDEVIQDIFGNVYIENPDPEQRSDEPFLLHRRLGEWIKIKNMYYQEEIDLQTEERTIVDITGDIYRYNKNDGEWKVHGKSANTTGIYVSLPF